MWRDDLANIACDGVNHAIAIAGGKWPRRPYDCPACNTRAAMLARVARSGVRRKAACSVCGALERHRLQAWVFDNILAGQLGGDLSVLHFAPEEVIAKRIRPHAGRYVTTDLELAGVGLHADICQLPFPDRSFDLVWASHVLEHVRDSDGAVAELLRVLRPGGLAVLPVPIVAARTIEYPRPVGAEAWHVRAPGLDFYSSYRGFDVAIYTSAHTPETAQTWVHEDRSCWPTAAMPFRAAMAGRRHIDAVPVCRKPQD